MILYCLFMSYQTDIKIFEKLIDTNSPGTKESAVLNRKY